MSQKRTTEQRLKVRAFARKAISIGRDRLIRQVYRHEVLHGAKPISAITQRAATPGPRKRTKGVPLTIPGETNYDPPRA